MKIEIPYTKPDTSEEYEILIVVPTDKLEKLDSDLLEWYCQRRIGYSIYNSEIYISIKALKSDSIGHTISIMEEIEEKVKEDLTLTPITHKIQALEEGEEPF